MIANVLVKDVMTSQIVTLTEFDPLQKAEEIFSNRNVHHIPILDKDKVKLIGILSSGDLERCKYGKSFFVNKKTAEYNEALLATTLIGSVMTKDVRTIDADQPIRDAYQVFKKNTYRSLPVLDSKKIIGIITPIDLLDYFFNKMR